MRISIILALSLFVRLAFGQQADLIIHNANIYNHEMKTEGKDAIAVADGRILEIGSLKDILKYKSADCKMLDAEGHFLMPGLIEGHGHYHSTGSSRLNLNLMGTKNWDEIVNMVKNAVKDALPGVWIEGRGWHQEKWNRIPKQNMRGFPVHDLLSEVSPDNPVVLRHASGHLLIANQKAMDLAGVNEKTVSPPGGEIFRNTEGKPVGVFNEEAMELIKDAKDINEANKTEEEKWAYWLKCIQKAEESCLKNGITSFHDAGSSFKSIARYKKLADQKKLKTRLWIMINDDMETIESEIKDHLDLGESGFFKIGGIKAYMDGALGSRGAWLIEPYTDMPETHGHRIISQDDFNKLSTICVENDIQLCTHAIGDMGNRVVFNTYESASNINDRRWRVEHAQHLNKNEITRFQELGVIAAMQPIHCTSDAPFVEKRLGAKRAKEGAYVWRKLLNSNAKLNIGTDTPVEDIDPFENIYAACTRHVLSNDSAFYPDQVMSREEVLYHYTMGNAYSVFEEEIKGSLDPGKLADIIILDTDLINCTNEEILETQVLYTIIGGKLMYEHDK